MILYSFLLFNIEKKKQLIKHNFKPSFKPYIYYLINNIVRKQQKKKEQ